MTAPIHENLGRFVWTLVPRQTDPFVNVQSELTFGLGRLAGWASPCRVKRRRMKMVVRILYRILVMVPGPAQSREPSQAEPVWAGQASQPLVTAQQ